MAEAAALARDLINTPSNDIGPEQLAQAAQALATRFGATFNCIVGDDHWPRTIRPSTRSAAPALVRPGWSICLGGGAPKVTLVGKGVCFDTGGLDMKPAGGMLLMKKDMGGAAMMLGAGAADHGREAAGAAAGAVPVVENSVSGNAMRPGDIVNTRKGLTVEIGNTDAEGRLILSDALAEARGEAGRADRHRHPDRRGAGGAGPGIAGGLLR